MAEFRDIQQIRSAVFGFEFKNPKTITASANSVASVAFSAAVRSVYLATRTSGMSFAVGIGSEGAVTADSSSTFIPYQEKLVIGVPSSATISAVGEGANATVLSVVELHEVSE